MELKKNMLAEALETAANVQFLKNLNDIFSSHCKPIAQCCISSTQSTCNINQAIYWESSKEWIMWTVCDYDS